jgi:hypothetical protein
MRHPVAIRARPNHVTPCICCQATTVHIIDDFPWFEMVNSSCDCTD